MPKAARELISQRAYAKRRGVSHVSVQRAVRSGRITLVAGKVDPALADEQWDENTDPTTPSNTIKGKNGADSSYASWRAHRERFAALNAELEYEENKKRLIDRDEVKEYEGRMVMNFRGQLLSLPPLLAPQVAIEDNPIECERLIRAALYEAMEELAAIDPSSPSTAPAKKKKSAKKKKATKKAAPAKKKVAKKKTAKKKKVAK